MQSFEKYLLSCRYREPCQVAIELLYPLIHPCKNTINYTLSVELTMVIIVTLKLKQMIQEPTLHSNVQLNYCYNTVYGKTFEGENFRGCAQNTPFTGKLSRCIRPIPLCTVHSK